MLSPQAGIAAPTLTVMQGFEAKKDSLCISFQVPAYCITHAQPNRVSNPGVEGWKLSTIPTTLPSLQQCRDKMSYLNQMYEKKAMARALAFAWLASTNIREWAGVSKLRKFHICSPSFSRLQQDSHYLNAEQHQGQVDLHRALTSSSQIATTAILLSFPPLEQHIQNNFKMLAQYLSKCIPHPQKPLLNISQWP